MAIKNAAFKPLDGDRRGNIRRLVRGQPMVAVQAIGVSADPHDDNWIEYIVVFCTEGAGLIL